MSVEVLARLRPVYEDRAKLSSLAGHHAEQFYQTCQSLNKVKQGSLIDQFFLIDAEKLRTMWQQRLAAPESRDEVPRLENILNLQNIADGNKKKVKAIIEHLNLTIELASHGFYDEAILNLTDVETCASLLSKHIRRHSLALRISNVDSEPVKNSNILIKKIIEDLKLGTDNELKNILPELVISDNDKALDDRFESKYLEFRQIEFMFAFKYWLAGLTELLNPELKGDEALDKQLKVMKNLGDRFYTKDFANAFRIPAISG